MVNFNGRHVYALLKKDYLIRRRQWIMTLVQFIWPCIIFMSLYILRNRFRAYTTEECQFPTRQLPSTNNLLPFFQSYICSIENKCLSPDQYREITDYQDAPVTPIINIVQTFLNEEKLYNAVVNLPIEKNFIGTVIAIVTHPEFKYIESNGARLANFLPEIEKIVGKDFDPNNLFSDNRLFSNFGKIICSAPFPRADDNIRFVTNVLETEDFSGADSREVRSLPTDYCKKLYKDISKTNNGKITWSVIKPLIQGRIIYGPDNNRTREIVSYANTTFSDMGRLTKFIKSVDRTFELLKTDTEFLEKFNQLIRLAKSPLVKQFAGESFDAEQVEATLNSILNDTRIASTINTIASAFDCFAVDRFVPVDSETGLEDKAYEFRQENMLYAAIYFPENSGNTTKYKLRMETDNTPVTALTKNLYWFPGPEGNFALDMRYHRGFIQTQHALDLAIINWEKSKLPQKDELEESVFPSLQDTKASPIPDGILQFEEGDDDDDDDDEFGEFDDDDEDEEASAKNGTSSRPNLVASTTAATMQAVSKEDLDFSSTETATQKTPAPSQRKKRQITNFLDSIFRRSSTVTPTKLDDVKYFTKQFPYPAYETDDFKKGLYLANAVQVAFFFALIVQVASSVRHRIWMKESGNSTLMRTMGLVQSAEIISWLITCILELIIIFILVLIVLYGGGILTFSSKGLMFIFLLIFGLSVVAFSFMMSTFFSSASIGTVAAVIIFMITFLPYIVVISLGPALGLTSKFLASFSASTAFSYAWKYALRVELQNRPFTFSNAFEGEFLENDFLFGITMIIVDTIIYSIIGGVCERFLRDDNNFYQVNRNLLKPNLGAEVVNVSKTYRDGGRKAIDDVSLVFERDQVTALLGRNGAGKSTLIKMLTGQLKPSSGEINLPPNYDLISGNKNNQEKIGLCSQNNILIPNLTAKEHLELYAKIKMRSGFDAEIKRIFNNLHFGKHRKYQAKELSGGYKRRLCIAIAFLASPNLVILDEPCSGVDTRARKNIWDLIQSLRKGRAVVLATHFMDEAERLSDKIVIINQGKIVSETSSEELKNKFTQTFELKVQFEENDKEKSEIMEKIRETIKETVPGTITSGTTKLIIPYKNESGDYYNFEPIISSLERLQVQKKIQRFNIATQNLKEIFNEHNEIPSNGDTNGHSSMIQVKDIDENEPEISVFAKIYSLFWKRWTHFTRNYRMLITMLVLPVIFECLAMLFLKIRPPGEYDVALNLNPREIYPHAKEFYSWEESLVENTTTNDFTKPIFNTITDQCDMDSQCEIFNNSKMAFDWLRKTEDDYTDKRFGGISINDTRFAIWYNNKGFHSMVAYLNQLNNAILKRELNDSSFNIEAINHPLKLAGGLSISSILQEVADAGVSLVLLVALSLVLAGASVFIVNERTNGEKLQQRLCGINFRVYWGVTFVWDFIIYGIAIASAAAVFEIFGIPLYVDKDQLGGICLLFFLFGFALIPAVHLFEKLFSEPSFANMSLFCLNVIIALTTMTMIVLLQILSVSDEDEATWQLLNKILLIFPQHALSDGLRQILQNYIVSKVFERFGIDSYKSPVHSDLLSTHFGSMIIMGIIFIILNYLIESKIIEKIFTKREKSEKSSTVSATELEFITIQNTLKRLDTYDMARNNFALNVENLRKKYHGHSDYAVKNVSFHVKDGECFGLLGANGAGKSTIFAILCGEILQTSGYVKMRKERGISYCPQTNALDPLLTVTEVIRFYGKLRKVRDLHDLTEKTLESLHLTQYKNVLVKNLSGGNRRKLSVAVTCFGNSNIVLMDEPTSDMDPITRNLVYKVINGLIKSNRAVLLTSHSISEIESICSKIVVLKDGKLLSTGTPRQLKDNYGNSYTITLFYNNSGESDKIDILKTFPTATSILEQNNSIQFIVKVKFSEEENENGDITTMHQEGEHDEIENKKILLSDLFARLHSLRNSHNIMYTVSECLLDQVLETILENGEPETNQGYVNKAFRRNETLT